MGAGWWLAGEIGGGGVAYIIAGMVQLTIFRHYLGDAQRGYGMTVVVWPLLTIFWGIIGSFILLRRMWKISNDIIEYQTRPKR